MLSRLASSAIAYIISIYIIKKALQLSYHIVKKFYNYLIPYLSDLSVKIITFIDKHSNDACKEFVRNYRKLFLFSLVLAIKSIAYIGLFPLINTGFFLLNSAFGGLFVLTIFTSYLLNMIDKRRNTYVRENPNTEIFVTDIIIDVVFATNRAIAGLAYNQIKKHLPSIKNSIAIIAVLPLVLMTASINIPLIAGAIPFKIYRKISHFIRDVIKFNFTMFAKFSTIIYYLTFTIINLEQLLGINNIISNLNNNFVNIDMKIDKVQDFSKKTSILIIRFFLPLFDNVNYITNRFLGIFINIALVEIHRTGREFYHNSLPSFYDGMVAKYNQLYDYIANLNSPSIIRFVFIKLDFIARWTILPLLQAIGYLAKKILNVLDFFLSLALTIVNSIINLLKPVMRTILNACHLNNDLAVKISKALIWTAIVIFSPALLAESLITIISKPIINLVISSATVIYAYQKIQQWCQPQENLVSSHLVIRKIVGIGDYIKDTIIEAIDKLNIGHAIVGGFTVAICLPIYGGATIANFIVSGFYAVLAISPFIEIIDHIFGNNIRVLAVAPEPDINVGIVEVPIAMPAPAIEVVEERPFAARIGAENPNQEPYTYLI